MKGKFSSWEHHKKTSQLVHGQNKILFYLQKTILIEIDNCNKHKKGS